MERRNLIAGPDLRRPECWDRHKNVNGVQQTYSAYIKPSLLIITAGNYRENRPFSSSVDATNTFGPFPYLGSYL